MSRIDILLATYNGAPFLSEQLASIEGQTHTEWRLLVRDDGSSDDTLEIVRGWASQREQEVRIIEDGRTGLGASLNFAAIMRESDAPYFACCDQDDVWLPEKLEVMLSALRKAEEEVGEGTPMLAYSDLKVVDGALGVIAPSFRDFARTARLQPGRELQQVMMHNMVAGCASLGNASLRELAWPVPETAVMHDWWLAMVAAGMGRLIDVPQATILYRQHGGNTLGANANDPLSLLRWVIKDAPSAIERSRKLLRGTQAQAGSFAERHGGDMDPKLTEIMRAYARLPQSSFPARKAFFLRNRMLSDNVLKNLPFTILA